MRIIDPAKLAFKREGEIKIFSDKHKLKREVSQSGDTESS